jgi:hypothetical protein
MTDTRKPFNLDLAKSGAPIETRDGRKVRFIAHVPEATLDTHRVVAVAQGIICLFGYDGRSKEGGSDGRDLFMSPTERTVWVNLYRDAHGSIHTDAITFIDECAARSHDSGWGGRIGTFPITYKE